MAFSLLLAGACWHLFLGWRPEHADKSDPTIIPPAVPRTYRTKLRNTGFLCDITLSVTPIAQQTS
ncbi:hypothetical protein JD505_11715 [Aeromonas hydrophila]|uniref:hypothetical protein n=1 Tax=Aeromonas hydrophila TaxID=644 RepID=UPI00191E9C3F|nr:hypothetical protein [Aeromonas hydrophila]MBL0569935.1 hypothetical protein [Aeromonas hydrophila]